MKLHHIGIACKDIVETLSELKKIYPVTAHSPVIYDSEQGASLCLISIEGSVPLELVSGAIVESFVRKGISLYHTCWEVRSLDLSIKKLLNEGCMLLVEPKRAVLFNFRRVAFLKSPTGLIELLEDPKL